MHAPRYTKIPPHLSHPRTPHPTAYFCAPHAQLQPDGSHHLQITLSTNGMYESSSKDQFTRVDAVFALRRKTPLCGKDGLPLPLGRPLPLDTQRAARVNMADAANAATDRRTSPEALPIISAVAYAHPIYEELSDVRMDVRRRPLLFFFFFFFFSLPQGGGVLYV
jgi:hypothetical protein